MRLGYLILVLSLLIVALINGCIGQKDEGEVKVVGGLEFQIQNAEYEAGKIIVTLKTNVSVENARIDIVDETNQLLCTRYKDLIAGVTDIEMTDCKAKERITVSVSPPGGGIVTREFTLAIPTPRVEIVSAEYELAILILKLDANLDVKNTRIEVSDERGTVVCTQYIDLSEGLNEIKPKGCGTETKITVSVTPPEGVMITADFTLELPLLEAKSGLNYQYKAEVDDESIITDVFITTETASEWQGVIGIKVDPDREALIIQFKLKKADLDLLFTYPLAREKVLSKDVTYKSSAEIGDTGFLIWPFIIAALKPFGLEMDEFIEEGSFTFTQSEGPQGTMTFEEEKIYLNWLAYHIIITDLSENEISFYVSVAKPYMLISLDLPEAVQPDKMIFTLEKVEETGFDLSYYAGYSIEEWTSPTPPREKIR